MEPERGTPEWFADLIERIQSHSHFLAPDDLIGLEYDAQTAESIISAHAGTNGLLWLTGSIHGNLTLTYGGAVHISAHVHGDISVQKSVQILVSPPPVNSIATELPAIGQDLEISGDVGGDLTIFGKIGGNLITSGSVGGHITHLGYVSGDFTVSGNVAGDLATRGNIGANLNIFGEIGGHVAVCGEIGGNFTASDKCHIRGKYTQLSGRCTGETVFRAVWANSEPVADLSRYRSVGQLILAPDNRQPQSLVLASVASAEFLSPIFIGDRVDISRCDFRQTVGIDHLELVGADLFPPNIRQLSATPAPTSEEIQPSRIPPLELASINRQLRTNLENRNNRPATNRFYRGEMNARLEHAAITRPWYRKIFSDWTLLRGYKLISDYGLSIWRPIWTAFILACVFTGAFAYNGLDIDPAVSQCPAVNPTPGCEHIHLLGLGPTFVFTLRSMVSFLSPPDAQLGPWGQLLQIVVRFTGPSLIALALLAVRNRVAR